MDIKPHWNKHCIIFKEEDIEKCAKGKSIYIENFFNTKVDLALFTNIEYLYGYYSQPISQQTDALFSQTRQEYNEAAQKLYQKLGEKREEFINLIINEKYLVYNEANYNVLTFHMISMACIYFTSCVTYKV